MLKQIQLNKKIIPVPIPIRNVREALQWVESTLILPNHTITSIVLDGEDIQDQGPRWASIILKMESRLAVQVDSPVDLSIQTLEAIRNLSTVIESYLKTLAVDCWQFNADKHLEQVETLQDDLILILDLYGHLPGLIEHQKIDFKGLYDVADTLQNTSVSLSMARSNSDWKVYAKILLNKLEPAIAALIQEAMRLQASIFTYRSEIEMPEGETGQVIFQKSRAERGRGK